MQTNPTSGSHSQGSRNANKTTQARSPETGGSSNGTSRPAGNAPSPDSTQFSREVAEEAGPSSPSTNAMVEGMYDWVPEVRTPRSTFTDVVRGAGNLVGDFARGVGDLAATGLEAGFDAYGDARQVGSRLSGNALAGAADLFGAERLGDRIRENSAAYGEAIDARTDFRGQLAGDFTRGFAEGAAGTAEGLAFAATDPIGVVEGIGELVQDPSRLLDGYREVLDEHGPAGLAGNLGFDVVTTVLTGGASTASTSGRLATTAARLDAFGEAGSLTGRLTSEGARALGEVERLGFGASDSLGNLVDRASGRPELPSGATAAVRNIDDVLGNARELDEFSAAAGRGDARALLDGIEGGEIVAGNRQQAVEFLRERFPDVSLERINRWVNRDAAALGEVAIIRAPAGTRVARGFNGTADTRGALQQNFDGLFTGNARADGGYFNLAEDVVGLNRGRVRAGNAVPVHNASDRLVIRQLEEEGYFLASRVAPQQGTQGFGPVATGGFRQLRFLDDTDILPVVGEVDLPTGFRPSAYGLGLVGADAIPTEEDF